MDWSVEKELAENEWNGGSPFALGGLYLFTCDRKLHLCPWSLVHVQYIIVGIFVF